MVNNVCINGAWTQALNSTVQAELAGTVWANYRLVSTQWPAGSGPAPQGCAFGVFCPGNLTNTTMETYVRANCMGCHATDKKILGPAFKEVAAKYKGKKDVEALLAGKIQKGSSGAWGPIAMPANPVSDAEAKALAKWVMAQ